MALSQSAVSELLEAFRAGQGLDLIRESVRMVLQELIEAEASEVVGAARYGRAVEQFIRSGTREAAVRAARAAEHVDPSGTSSRRTCRACRPPRLQDHREERALAQLRDLQRNIPGLR